MSPTSSPSASWTTLFKASLSATDHEIAALIETQREQNHHLVNLVASESYCPRATLEAEASALVNKNASGYPPRSSLGDSDILDRIETIAVERSRRLFGAEHANIQALSSTIANIAVLRALVRPGGRILAFDRTAGGHGSHGGSKHVSGQDYEVRTFGVDETNGAVDYAAAEASAKEFRPHIIIAGSSNYPRAIDFARLSRVAAEVGALMFADIAHVAGLVIAGLHPNPVPDCDAVTTSTHKTFCGPRTGGLILCQARHAKAIDAALSPGLQAAPGAHIIAARAVLFDLVARPAFRDLMGAVVANAATLAEQLGAAGIPLYTGGTDTHMVVIDLRAREWNPAELNRHLVRHGLAANTVPLPVRAGCPGRFGLRLGSTAMTIRGADADAFATIAECLATLLANFPKSGPDPVIRARMAEIAARYPIPFQ